MIRGLSATKVRWTMESNTIPGAELLRTYVRQFPSNMFVQKHDTNEKHWRLPSCPKNALWMCADALTDT